MTKFTSLYSQHSAIEKSMNAATDRAVRAADFAALLRVEAAIDAERDRVMKIRLEKARRRERQRESILVQPLVIFGGAR